MASEVKSYIVRTALVEDINNPFIWFSALDCESREIVKITNKTNSKSVWCEIIIAGDNFIDRYNKNKRTINVSRKEPFLVANDWYRKKLGLTKNEITEVEIIHGLKWSGFVPQLFASYKHPDNTVRLAVDLGFVSLGLGILGLILGVISLFG